jgi:hypothetical protein
MPEQARRPACYRVGRRIKPGARLCPVFQVSGRSLSDALEGGMTTYREVVMAAIST